MVLVQHGSNAGKVCSSAGGTQNSTERKLSTITGQHQVLEHKLHEVLGLYFKFIYFM